MPERKGALAGMDRNFLWQGYTYLNAGQTVDTNWYSATPCRGTAGVSTNMVKSFWTHAFEENQSAKLHVSNFL